MVRKKMENLVSFHNDQRARMINSTGLTLLVVSEDSRAAAEEATEATEGSSGVPDHSGALRGVYTEHVFTDPLGVQQTSETAAGSTQR